MKIVSAPKSPEIIEGLRKKQEEYRRRFKVEKSTIAFALALVIIGTALFMITGIYGFMLLVFSGIWLLVRSGEGYVDTLYKRWVIKERLNPKFIDTEIYLYIDEAPESIIARMIGAEKCGEIFNRAMRVINDYSKTGGKNTFKDIGDQRVPSALLM
ncbi:MAG: hypothetical protein PHU42_00330 [Patescibacteria group bacterium]|nr:hypothetical protein [Patescibacteria group bacterium]